MANYGWDPTQGLFGYVTRDILHLPELGISEALGGKTGSLSTASSKKSNKEKNTTKIDSGSKTTKIDSGSKKGSNSISGGSSITNYSNLYKNTGGSGKSNNGSGKSNNVQSLVDKARRKEEERARKAAEERKRMLEEARSAYNPFFKELSRQEAELPTIQQNYLDVMNTGYGSQVASINRAQEAGLQQANQAQDVIKQNQATSLRDLASNLSNAVNAFGQRLGQAGAGDSSAANMANYGYSKIANRNVADVTAQVRGQLAEVETTKTNIVRDAQDKLGALESWKATQTNAIQQYVNSLRDYINQARAQGKTTMAQNEVDAIRSGFEAAQTRLQQINDLELTTKAEILQNADAALAEANAFGQKLQQMGNIQINPITQQPIDTGLISSGGDSSLLAIPTGLTREEERERSLADLLYGAGSGYTG